MKILHENSGQYEATLACNSPMKSTNKNLNDAYYGQKTRRQEQAEIKQKFHVHAGTVSKCSSTIIPTMPTTWILPKILPEGKICGSS